MVLIGRTYMAYKDNIKLKIKNRTLLNLFILLLLYSSALRIVGGRYATIIADAFMIILLVIALFHNNLRISISKPIKAISIAIIGFLLLAVVQIFNTNINNYFYALIEFRKSYFQLLAFFVGYIYFKNSDYKINDLLRFINIASLPIVIYGIKQTFHYDSIDEIFYSFMDADSYTYNYGGSLRAISIFSGPFHYGLFCVSMMTISLGLVHVLRQKKYFIFVAIEFWGCVCSETRTNIICCGVVLVVWVLFYFSNSNKRQDIYKKIFISIVLMFLIILLVIAMSKDEIDDSTVLTLINSILNASTDGRFLDRIETWESALSMISSNPIFGYGIGSAGDTLSQYNVATTSVTPHNMFLKVFVELGLLGLILFSVIIILFVISIKKINNRWIKMVFIGLVLNLFINGLVGSTLGSFPVVSVIYMLFGCLYATQKR